MLADGHDMLAPFSSRHSSSVSSVIHASPERLHSMTKVAYRAAQVHDKLNFGTRKLWTEDPLS